MPTNEPRAKLLGVISLVMSVMAVLTAVVIMTVILTVPAASFTDLKNQVSAVHANFSHMVDENDFPPPAEAEELPWEFD